MKMIGHHHIFIQDDFFSEFCGFQPFGFHDFSKFAEPHFALFYSSKQAFLFVAADSDAESTVKGIIETF